MRLSAVAVSVLWIGVTTTSIAAQELAQHALRSEVLGCWTLFDARGAQAKQTMGGWAPLQMELLSQPDASRWSQDFPVARALVVHDSAPPSRDPRPLALRTRYSQWTADSLSDTVRTRYGNGLTGVWFAFAVPALPRDTLFGWAQLLYDDRPRVQPVPARAIRSRCP